MGEEPDCMANIRFQNGKKFGEWIIKKRLDEGGFGQVYMVMNMRTNERGAMKAESNDVEGGSAIKLEIMILRDLNKKGPKPHIPRFYHAAKRSKYCYMIMTLLGENLKHLRQSCNGERFTKSTWSRLGIQCLYSLKFVHDAGYVHRDIKPNNFVMGHPQDPKRARIVHILDFGLARAFAFEKNDKWIARRARGTAEFRGTLRYVSPNVHQKKEQGRVDDLWSLLYVLIECNGGLPWQNEKEKANVELMKTTMSDKDLVINLPPSMATICPHLRTLDCYMRPDYMIFYTALKAIMDADKVTPLTRFDFEMPNDEEIIKKFAKENGPAEWEAPEEFFKSDPMKINGPPKADDKSSEKRQKDNKLLTECATNTEQTREGSSKKNDKKRA